MKFHPYANIFPLLEGAELQALADDISANGLQEPIWIYKNQIIDGRNRWRACEIAGIKPKVRRWTTAERDTEAALLQFVISANLHRRHLNESQRAMVAARIATMRQGARTDLASKEAMSQTDAAEALNVSRPSVQRARKIQEKGAPELIAAVDSGRVKVGDAASVASLPKPEQRRLLRRVESGEDKNLHQAAQRRSRDARTREVGLKAAEVGRFPVLLADPPWRYEHSETDSRKIENQYQTMSLEAIRSLSVQEIAAEDAILFLWATSPKLEEALSVVRSWGFVYRTCAVWDKKKVGMGYYFRQRHELLLVATRGAIPPPSEQARPVSVIEVPRGKHSEKPTVVYELIEAMYPGLSKVELFARRTRAGWSAWGNEVS